MGSLNPLSDIAKDNISVGEGFGAKTEKEGWYGQDLEVKADPIIDPGTGPTLTIRVFEFSKNPEFKGNLTKQELFNMHWRQISTMLWSDGLVAIEEEDFPPKVEVDKDDPLKYKIFVVCKPKMGSFFVDSAKPLHEVIHKKKR